MPGLQTDDMSAAVHTPVKKSRLSLKFFQKKDTKRTLEFSESQVEEQKPSEREEPESCDQVVPTPGSCVPLVCDKRDGVVPFVGLNNLGNTCYLNSILQVLYYCPGFKDAIKKLRNLSKKTEKQKKDTENEEVDEEVLPMNIELLWSLHHLITSMEQLQSSFLLNPKKYIDSELATSPRRLLNTLRLLNPMYEGYLQHDAQEVLRCILGYIQEACESIEKEQKIEELPEKQAQNVDCGERKDEREQNSSLNESAEESSDKEPTTKEPQLDESSKDQSVSKRKSDTEAGNAKKRSKCLKPQSRRTSTAAEEAGHFTRSKRKSSGEVSAESDQNENKETSHVLAKVDGASTVPAKRPKQSKLSWLKPSGKQPSIFSKFRSMGKISTHAGGKDTKAKHEEGGDSLSSGKDEEAAGICSEDKCPVDSEEKSPSQAEEHRSLNLMERMFQGQLVLRTRCLECECYTERREDFQDISVPVQEIEFCRVDPDLEVSPDPKQESKTLKWAISQFASVERIVGEDKYFCETCHHYTEAERSLLFDKTPEVVTIHLKCFAASGSGLDPYAGLSKVSTPLHTPLKLSLEEWCTRPSKEHYELFAVVMHSGVTISSGHYTTYVKMVNLKDVKVELVDDSLKPESPGAAAAEAYNPARGYNDGEVSVGAASKAGAKKAPEGVGLLGGQRSVSGFELGGGKQANPDKGIKEECSSSQGHQTTVRNKSEREPIAVASAGKERDDAPVDDGDDLALCNLLDYEGKWMLFDDSEVRLFEEKDFLNACSPETCTTSIPYLLFYKKVLE